MDTQDLSLDSLGPTYRIKVVFNDGETLEYVGNPIFNVGEFLFITTDMCVEVIPYVSFRNATFVKLESDDEEEEYLDPPDWGTFTGGSSH